MSGGPDMRGVLADLRHALRVYWHAPIASAVTIAALAVAMAFVSAFLSLWNDLAMRPHPGFERSGQLVTVAFSNGDVMAGMSIAFMQDLNEHVNTLQGVATDQLYPHSVHIDGERIDVLGEVVVTRYFELLRPRLLFGRAFEASDHHPDAEPVVVLSHAFWQRHFGGSRDVLGQQLEVELQEFAMRRADGSVSAPQENVQRHRIVGVMAPGMKGTFQQATETWMPFEQVMARTRAGADGTPPSMADLYASYAGLTGVGRLAAGASVAEVRNELEQRYTVDDYELVQLRASNGMRIDAIAGVHLDLKSRREGLEQVRLFLAGTVLLASVAACNASLFLLSRAPGRLRELAIRTALGATRRRLARQLVSEAALLIGLAVVAGLLASLWLNTGLRELPFFTTVRWRDATPVDWRVLLMLSAIALVTTALVAATPVHGLKRLSLSVTARNVSARAGWGQRLAGTLQLMVATVLASVALAAGWALLENTLAEQGFDTDGILMVTEAPRNFRDSRPGPAVMLLDAQRRLEVIGGLPGVASVTFSSAAPGVPAGFVLSMPPAGLAPGAAARDPDEQVQITYMPVAPDFPAFLGLRLAHGNSFDPADPSGFLVNETAARSIWGRTDVVGEEVHGPLIGLAPGTRSTNNSNKVIGVLRDVYFTHPDEGMPAMVFTPVGPDAPMVLVRTTASPRQMRTMIQQKIDDGDIEMVIGDVRRLHAVWRDVFARDRARMQLTAAAAAVTVALAAFGCYGTQRYLVAAGRREYAIRSALGAGPSALGRLVLWRGVGLSLPGLAFGGILAYITLATLRDDFLSQASSPLVVACSTVLAMAGLVIATGVGPARQARRTLPAPLLRAE